MHVGSELCGDSTTKSNLIFLLYFYPFYSFFLQALPANANAHTVANMIFTA